MIKLNLDWRETLWWFQGGIAGSHLRWNCYDDMVNKVWPQCSEQERWNMWFIMRRDLGTCWRPDGWNGFDISNAHGEGEWREDIMDKTPWNYFRQVLARFDYENQYAVTLPVHNAKELDEVLRFTPDATIISRPSIPRTKEKYDAWHSNTATVTVRAYKWHDMNGNDAYFIDWKRRCDPERIIKVERIDIPYSGVM